SKRGGQTDNDRILVMDDEEPMRKLTGEILGRLGYEVALVENGEKAIECYQSAIQSGRPFDVIILDLTIRGGLGGQETIKQLLRIDPGARAILSSGYDQDPVILNYESYGFKGVLIKPFFIDQLMEVLSGVMSTPDRNSEKINRAK
ncbi:MAG TPA: response regulator, partial [Thermodesulfobacteriota bacterium]|nr:response regulator [Thermodesulfobacteriota bacterium]